MRLNDNFGGMYRIGGIYIILYAHTRLRLKNVWTLWTLWTIDKYAKTINCYYATPLYFYRVNRIFFGFRAFYLFFIQILAVILHRNSKSPHVHRTLIALPSHTRTWVAATRRSSSAKEQARSLRRSKHKQRAELNYSTDYALLNNEQALLFFILDNEKFCLILLNRPKAVVL